MFSKAEIFDQALSALLLRRRVIDTETDSNNEVAVLRDNYDHAFKTTLSDLDLDSTSETLVLELIESAPNDRWSFSYKYPSKCLLLRRITSLFVKDNRETHLAKNVAIKDGQKVIFCNEQGASADCIVSDVPLATISVNAGLAIAYRLAILSAPLLVGKGSKSLTDKLEAKYIVFKAEAQENDSIENFMYHAEEVDSEFLAARVD